MKKFNRLRVLLLLTLLMGCGLSSFYNSPFQLSGTRQTVKGNKDDKHFPDQSKMNMTRTRNELYKEWINFVPSLPFCRLFPEENCKDAAHKSHWRFNAPPAAQMRKHIMGGIGGEFLSLVTLLSFVVGIGLSSSVCFQDGFIGMPNVLARLHYVDSVCPIHSHSYFGRLMKTPMIYWSGTASFTFTYPVTSFKLFIVILLLVDLNGLDHFQSVLAAPEAVELFRPEPQSPSPFITLVATWLMPSDLENDKTADLFVHQLHMLRGLLLMSWFTYLILPARCVWVSGICYVVGAIAFIYLAILSILCSLTHTLVCTIDFLLFTIPAVPFLGCPKHGQRAACWLRRLLYLGVLIPLYLFAGKTCIIFVLCNHGLVLTLKFVGFNI